MRKAAYWLGATALVIALLLLIFGVAFLISESALPFQRIWASVLTLLGFVLIAASRFRAATLLRQFGGTQKSRRNSLPPSRAFLAVYGIALVAGGIGYGITGNINLTIGALGIVVLHAGWVRSIQPPPDDPPPNEELKPTATPSSLVE